MTFSIGRAARFSYRPSVLLILTLVVAGGCDGNYSFQPVVLDGLDITGTKTSLNPAFEPNIFRYSVIANDPADEVQLTPSASESVIISINGAITSSNTVYLINTLTPGDVVEIRVQGRGRQKKEFAVYEVVYLPADFPELTVTVLEDEVSLDPLYVNMNGPSKNYAAILDNHGVPTFFIGNDQRVIDFKWHAATGERSYARRTGTINQWGRTDAEQVVLDSDFNEIDRIRTVGLSHTDVHDFLIQPNGELILIAYDGGLRDLTAFGLTAEEVVEDSVIQVIDRASRQVLFEWNSWGQVPYEDQTYPVKRNEYAHVNSVIEDFDGNLIVSARGTSQVVKISRPGGQVLWKLGGKSNQFQFINDPFSHLCGQHTASRLENGNLLIFDNGQNCWPIVAERGELTRIVEYRLDEQALEAELVWSYTQDDVYTLFAGSAQRLPNGNTLIGWGGRPSVFATEVNSEGEKVFELIAFHGDDPVVGYRVRRYPE